MMRVVLILAMVMAGMCRVQAQTMIGFGPNSVLQRVEEATSPPLSAPASQPLAPSPPAQNANKNLRTSLAPSSTVLRHLPNGLQGYRLVGEIDASEWPLYLSAHQVTGAQRLRLGFMSAVSVMPEASVLTVAINDQVVGHVNIRAAGNVRTVEFDVPQGLLVAGFNVLRISVDQRHRVDCSLGATYELWTQIDPAQTGLVIAREMASIDRIDDVGALLPDAQGALPVRIVLPARTSPANIERNLRAVQMLALKGRFEQTVSDVGVLAEGDFGVNLVVGTHDDIRTIEGLPSIPIDMSGVYVFPADDKRRTTLVITGQSEDDVNRAFVSFAEINEVRGHNVGIRAARAFPGYRVEPPQRIGLKHLGLVSQDFSGRFYRAAFNIIMPADFYPADYARAALLIDGAYAAGLSPDSQILVTTNGKNASSIRLPKASGDLLHKNEISIGLGMLRPGLNRIEIEALVPTADDSSCDALKSLSGQKRFLFLDSSEIVFPPIARIARLPDLSVTASGGFPYAQAHLQSMLYLPVPDRHSIAAAATLAARMAVSAGQIIDFRLVTSMPARGSGALLMVGAYPNFHDILFEQDHVLQNRIDEVWRGREQNPDASDERLSRYEAMARNRLVLQKNFPAACHMPKPPQGFVTASRQLDPLVDSDAAHAATQDMFMQWQNNLHKKTMLYRLEQGVGQLKALFVQAGQYAHDQANLLFDDAARVNHLVTNRSSLIVMQSLNGPTQDDLMTLVFAPNPADLNDSMACLIDPRVWRQMDGQVAALDATEGRLSIVPALNQKLVASQPFTLSNMRLVVASWMTTHKSYYVSLALVLALLLGLSTLWFVSHVGKRNP